MCEDGQKLLNTGTSVIGNWLFPAHAAGAQASIQTQEMQGFTSSTPS